MGMSASFLGAPAGDKFLCACQTTTEVDEAITGWLMSQLYRFVAFVVFIVFYAVNWYILDENDNSDCLDRSKHCNLCSANPPLECLGKIATLNFCCFVQRSATNWVAHPPCSRKNKEAGRPSSPVQHGKEGLKKLLFAPGDFVRFMLAICLCRCCCILLEICFADIAKPSTDQKLQKPLGTMAPQPPPRMPVLSQAVPVANPVVATDGNIYDELDTDGSGEISLEELTAAAARLGLQVSAEYIAGVWAVYDIDGNGELNRDEFRRLMTVLAKKDENTV